MKYLISLFLSSLAIMVSGQATSGRWTFHSPFDGVDLIAVTPSRVYFSSAGALYSYDIDSDITEAHSSLTDLSDVGVVMLEADGIGSGNVAVAYESGNIDVIRPDEKVVNLPDIMVADASPRTVSSMRFGRGGEDLIVATPYGVVLFDLKRGEVSQSGIYQRDVKLAVPLKNGGYIMRIDDRLYALPAGESLSKRGSLVDLGDFGDVTDICPVSDGKGVLLVTKPYSYYSVALYEFDFSDMSFRKVRDYQGTKYSSPAFIHSRDALYLSSEKGIHAFSQSDGSLQASYSLDKDIASAPLATLDGLKSLWSGNDEGLARFSLDAATGALTMLSDRAAPGSMPVRQADVMRFAPSSGNLYFSTRGNSIVLEKPSTGHRQRTARLTPDGEWENMTARDVSLRHDLSNNNSSRVILDAFGLAEDPDNSDVYYIGSLYEGLYAIDGREETEHFFTDNAPFTDYYGVRVSDVAFDKDGNMWVATESDSGNDNLFILPADKRKSSEVSSSDWISTGVGTRFSCNRDGVILHSSAHPGLVYVMGRDCQLLIYDYGKNVSDLSDDAYEVIDRYVDSDGSEVTFQRVTSLAEDKSGALWIGTWAGVMRVDNPRKALEGYGTLSVVRPRVARNDGTNFADYLLASEKIMAISADDADCKWIATGESGIYYVNQRGTEILDHFSTSNSPLPTNRITSLIVNPLNGNMFVSTPDGLFEYQTLVTPAADSFSDVKIFPNPARPGSSPVTITGLMENSIVKILDSAGNLVAQLRSEGGTARWDVTTIGGRDARSGIYHVMASSPSDSGKVVGKIAVVN